MSEKPSVEGFNKVLANAPKPLSDKQIKAMPDSPLDKARKQENPTTEPEEPTEPAMNPLMIAGITLLLIGVIVIMVGLLFNSGRRHVDYVIQINEYTDSFTRKQVGTLELQEDEYVYGYESIVRTPLQEGLPPELYVFFGFHEDDTNKSRFKYGGSTQTPQKYNNGILALDGAISNSMDENVLSSSPYLYNVNALPLTYDALINNKKAMYKANLNNNSQIKDSGERTVYLRKSDQRQFKAGQMYFAIMEFHPSTAINLELDVTIRVHVRKRHDFTLF
jgi:hypothetical protein